MKTIFIVDDEFDIADSLRSFFEAENYNVLIETSANKALEMLPTLSPDLVLVDQMMPDMSGCDLIQKLRETVKAPIILMSASKEPQTSREDLWQGFIAKPFDIDRMIGLVNTLTH